MSRIEKILQAIIDGTSYSEAPQSRIEEILLAIKNDTDYLESPYSRIEEILLAIKNETSCDKEPMSRIEEILMAKLHNEEYTKLPESRIEELLIEWLIATAYKELEDIPPLTFTTKKAGSLENYRIFGNAVDAASVGDRTANLFDKFGSQYGNNLHWVAPCSLVYSDTYYGSPIMDVTGLNTITRSYTGTGANYFLTSDLSRFVNVSKVGTVDAGVTVNVPDGYTKYVFNIPNTIRPDSIMVNSGSTTLPYEPYGYKVAVTVTNGTNTEKTNIYLDEPLGKSGDDTDYIDYKTQKRYNIDGTSEDVTLPGITVPAGTDTLSVGTTVQPSKVYVKYKGG